jgi:hypothetical protein
MLPFGLHMSKAQRKWLERKVKLWQKEIKNQGKGEIEINAADVIRALIDHARFITDPFLR